MMEPFRLRFIQPIFDTKADFKGKTDEEIANTLEKADATVISILSQSTLRYRKELEYLRLR